MKIKRQDISYFISNIKRKYPQATDEEFAEHLCKYMEVNPGCINITGVNKPGRYYYSTVEYGVFSLMGEKYAMGRIEIFDKENESGYQVDEGIYTMPFEAASQFRDFIESIETDLPIHLEIGNHDWCANECAKSLGFKDDKEMSDPEIVKAYRKKQNDDFAKQKGYKDFDDLLANSKFGNKNK